jgi:hypothetical protein
MQDHLKQTTHKPEHYKTSRTEEKAPSKTKTYTGTSVQLYQHTNTEDPTKNSAASPCFVPTSNF